MTVRHLTRDEAMEILAEERRERGLNAYSYPFGNAMYNRVQPVRKVAEFTPVQTHTPRAAARIPVIGYAALWDVLGEDDRYGVFRTFKAGCFSRSLANPSNSVDLLWDHSPDEILASTKQGDLKVWEDEIGLGFRWYVNPGNPRLKEIRELLRQGILGASCGYKPSGDPFHEYIVIDRQWRNVDTAWQVDDLVEITLTTSPRFPQTRRFLEILDGDYQ